MFPLLANVVAVVQPDKWAGILDKLKSGGLSLIAALAIYIIGFWVAKAVTNVIRKALMRKNVDGTLISFFANIVYALLMVFVVVAAIGKLGVQTTSLVAIIGAAGLAVGLALQGSLSNFAAGVMIILFRPFKLGDSVVAGGQTGKVHDIGIFSTVILTSDNKKIIVPNTAITGGAITNLTAMPTRRIELSVSVPGTTDLSKGRDILKGLLESDSRILKDPAPSISIGDATAGEIKYGVFAHVSNPDLGAVQSDLLEKIKHAFNEAGIWV
jgi:small conductance mechanosensitive channel